MSALRRVEPLSAARAAPLDRSTDQRGLAAASLPLSSERMRLGRKSAGAAKLHLEPEISLKRPAPRLLYQVLESTRLLALTPRRRWKARLRRSHFIRPDNDLLAVLPLNRDRPMGSLEPTRVREIAQHGLRIETQECRTQLVGFGRANGTGKTQRNVAAPDRT
jgi:hypothetical protein